MQITTIAQELYGSCRTVLGQALSRVRTATGPARVHGRTVRHRFQPHLIYLHTLWLELCNVHRRMEILRRKSLHRTGICLQSPLGLLPRTHPDHDRYLRARICGMRELVTIHPGATLVDLYLLTTIISPHLFEEGPHREAVMDAHTYDKKYKVSRTKSILDRFLQNTDCASMPLHSTPVAPPDPTPDS